MNEGSGPHKRKKNNRSDEHANPGFLVLLNKSNIETHDGNEEGKAITNMCLETDAFLSALEGLLFFVADILVVAVEVFLISAYILDSTAAKLLIEQFASLVSEAALDGKILKFVILEC